MESDISSMVATPAWPLEMRIFVERAAVEHYRKSFHIDYDFGEEKCDFAVSEFPAQTQARLAWTIDGKQAPWISLSIRSVEISADSQTVRGRSHFESSPIHSSKDETFKLSELDSQTSQ